MAGEAPARHDRAAARDDAGHPLRRQRHIGQPDAGVDGEIVDALFGLLDQRVLEHLPVELQGIAADLFQRLIDRHRADRRRRIAQDPGADVVDVASGREVHHRIGAPADRPDHLLDFLGDARAHGGIADVGVDLDEEVAADRHRLELDVIDVGGNDGAPPRHLAHDEFGRHEFRDRRPEALAVGDALAGVLDRRLARQVLAMRHIDHFFSDDSGAGEFELGDRLAGPSGSQGAFRRAKRRQMVGRDGAVVLGPDRPAFDRRIAARGDPAFADRWETTLEIDPRRAFGIGAGRVIDPDRRLFRVAERNLAERHADIRATLRRRIDLAGAADRSGGDGLRRSEFRHLVHGRLLVAGIRRRNGRQEEEGGRYVPSPA